MSDPTEVLHLPTATAAAVAREPVRPLVAVHHDGDVHVIVDPGTARRLADAWAMHHVRAETAGDAGRVRWMDDVVELLWAASMADVQRDQAPDPAVVPLLRPGRPSRGGTR